MGISCPGLAVTTQTEELQPVFADAKSGATGDGVDQRLQIIALEECRTAALAADQEMLVAKAGGNEGLAVFALMDTLDQAELLKLFERAVDTYEPQGAVPTAGGIVHFQRGDGARTGRDRMDDRPSCGRQPVAVALQLVEPDLT
jgi:hypothetical protein